MRKPRDKVLGGHFSTSKLSAYITIITNRTVGFTLQ
jgi:hypothetical protein